MTAFSALLREIETTPDALRAAIGDDWRQGRTLYGGISAALCVEAAMRAVPDLPPLRSAQFAFVGPASGVVCARHTVLRRGKSTVFVAVDLAGDAGLATRATLCFAAPRVSVLSYRGVTAPVVPPPAACADFFDARVAPAFARHFEARRAGGAMPVSGADVPELVLWIRHRDRLAGCGATALIALADAAPPAAMTMFRQGAPISTMTWSVEMLAEAGGADDWLLLRSRGEMVGEGYSTQAMMLWDAAGRMVMSGTQCVAVFL